ncbi:MAG: hypothetical protein AB9880_00120 [Christensenellales bacterium]
MQGLDNYRTQKDKVFDLYLRGYSAAEIGDRTGVPRVRIQREIDYQTERHPEMLARHLRARQSHHKAPGQGRYPAAHLVMSPAEMHRSNGEY